MQEDSQHHVAIIGTGQMGLVMADAMACRGVHVSIWGPRPETVGRLASQRALPERLPGVELDSSVVVSSDPREILGEATMVLNAIPTQFIRPTLGKILEHAPPGVPIISTAKGIENGTLMRPSEVLGELAERQHGCPSPLAVLSGPTIATELARRLPAVLVSASDDIELAAAVQDLLDVPWIRTYTLDDPLGVELAGATKNVIALAAGMVDGLGTGDNAKSALLARGLAEIARLGTSLGAKLETFFGIAGVGDLATTCFSPHGRNRTCGEAIGRGESLVEIQERSTDVVEGVATTRSVLDLADREGVDMPITSAVGSILFDGTSPADAIEELMDRALRPEALQ